MNADSNRPLGPAIIKDIMDFIVGYEKLENTNTKQIVSDAVSSFIIPQFEGLEKSALEKLKKLLNTFCIETKIDLIFNEMFE